MSTEQHTIDDAVPLRITRQIDALCDEFEAALRSGGSMALSPYVARIEEQWRGPLIKELASLALDQLRRDGAQDPFSELILANHAWREDLERIRHDPDGMPTIRITSESSPVEPASGLVVRCPHCHNSIDLVVDASLIDIDCSTCGSSFSLISDAEHTRDASTLTRVAHFELVERLGMGEFGTVWKARDTILDRTVAIKIPRRQQLDAASIEKFMREARAAAQLRHPNIIGTHEVGRYDDTLYIVNDYIRGVSLADVISDHRLGVRESVVITATVADALDHAHQRGIVHRDVKPSNVLIDDSGEPHLMDFGLAKRREGEIAVTTEGAILGTPAYMSPEQARGQAQQVDGRSDVYSLGVILFQLLTGELPFRGTTRVLLQKVINDDPPGPRTLDSQVPKDLDTICLKCLEKEPHRRYDTAAHIAADLRRYMAGEPVLARRIGPFGRTFRWARRNRAIATMLAATITTLLVAAVVSTYFALRATSNLYESLLQEIRLTREVRTQGYGERIRHLVDRARTLPAIRVDDDELRRQLALTMGDFAAYVPSVIVPRDGQFTTFCLSTDGRELFVGKDTGRLVVYDVDSGKQLAEPGALDGNVIELAVTDRNDRLVAADQTGTVGVWRRVNRAWEFERALQLGEAPDAICFSPHGQRVATMKGAQLDVWDVVGGTKLTSLPTEPDWTLRNGAFDLPRKTFVATYVNEQANTVGWALWNLETGERLHEVEMPSLGGTYVNSIALTQAGDRLAIGFDLGLVVIDMKEYQQTNLSVVDSTTAVAFSPTDPYLAAVNIRGSITVWNSTTNRQLATLHLPSPSSGRSRLAFSADGGRLVAANATSTQIWDLTKADEVTVMTGHNGAIPCATFHPNGELLATGGKDKEVRFWNSITGRQIVSIDLGDQVQTLAFSPEGRLLAVGCMGRIGVPHLRLIDVESKKLVYEVEPAMGYVLSLAWSDGVDGRYLAASGLHGVALWKLADGDPLRLETILEHPGYRCVALAFDQITDVLVWAESDIHLKAWDWSKGREAPLHAPNMHQGWHGLALLPDRQSIIYVSHQGIAEVWDVKRNRHVDALGGVGTFVAPHLALSPDGTWFAALTQLDTVSIWHLPTRKHVFTLRPATAAVWSLAWDPSSKHLAVGQADGALAIWHLARIQDKLAEAGLPWQSHD